MLQSYFTDSKKIAHSKILVIGDVMVDRYWHGTSQRISPEAPVPVLNHTHSEDRAGGAANVAVNIAKLGAQVGLIGLIGEDEAGEKLKGILKSKGIDSHLITCNNPTICKLRLMASKHQLLRVDQEKAFIPDERLYEQFEAILPDYDLIVISDYNKGSLGSVERLIHIANKYQVKVLLDPKRIDPKGYQKATIVTPNRKEFEQWVGECSSEIDFQQKGIDIMHKYQWDHLLITRSEQGMTLLSSDSNNTINLPAQAKDVFDVTGAGDTVIATLACMVAIQTPIDKAAQIANIAAGIAISKAGTVSVSIEEIIAWQKTQENTDSSEIDKTTDSKINKNLDELSKKIQILKNKNKKIILTNGCFDILHPGHVNYLKEAKSLGDILIVAINSDLSVKENKGENRPINSMENRMEVLASLESVSFVIGFNEKTPNKIIEKIKPDILVKGGDYSNIQDVVGYEIVLGYGGDVKVLSHKDGISTTTVIEKIKKIINSKL